MKRAALAFLFLMTGNAEADPVRIDVSKQDCARLNVVPANYVAGVSSTGQPVVPADVNGNVSVPLPDFENMSFPVYLDLERDYPFLNSELNTGIIPVARVTFENGKVFVNGTLVSETTVDTLKDECRNRFK